MSVHTVDVDNIKLNYMQLLAKVGDLEQELNSLRSDLSRYKQALEEIRDHEHCKTHYPQCSRDPVLITCDHSEGHKCCAVLADKAIKGEG